MNYHRNEKGIALVMALVLCLIALAIVSALLFFITQGTSVSGLMKRYATAQEAAKGGIDVFTKEIINETFKGDLTLLVSNYSSSVHMSNPFGCLPTRLTYATADWGPACTIPPISPCPDTPDPYNPKCKPDITFRLSGIAPQPDFDVFVKVVDTMEGNSDISGLDLEGMGVVEGSSGLITPALQPYMYRVEVQSERVNSTNERANLSLLYAY